MLAEDQTLVRRGFIALLHEKPHLQVIGEAGNGRELLDLLKRQQPDIVLLDIEMPVMNGRETLGIIKKRFPKVKVIMLSMYKELTLMSDFMASGACAYLAKGCDADVLLEAIDTVTRDGHYFDKDTSAALLNGLQQEKAIHPLLNELALTRRETAILKQLCDGLTNVQIAQNLSISHNTVDFHRGNIYSKTGCKNMPELVKFAIRHGLIPLT